MVDLPDARLHDGVHLGVIAQQLHQGANAVDVGLVGVLPVPADHLVLELAYGLVTIEGYLPHILLEMVREVRQKQLEELRDLFIFERCQYEF